MRAISVYWALILFKKEEIGWAPAINLSQLPNCSCLTLVSRVAHTHHHGGSHFCDRGCCGCSHSHPPGCSLLSPWLLTPSSPLLHHSKWRLQWALPSGSFSLSCICSQQWGRRKHPLLTLTLMSHSPVLPSPPSLWQLNQTKPFYSLKSSISLILYGLTRCLFLLWLKCILKIQRLKGEKPHEKLCTTRSCHYHY